MPPSYSKRRRRANRLSIQARLVSNYAAEYSAVTGGTVMEIKLSPSILSADFANLARDIKIATDAGAEYVHVDVMDGHFVPNITIGAPVVKALRKATDKVLDVHLMISDPDQYLDDFIKAGSDIITVHYESNGDTLEQLKKIRAAGVKAACVIKPKTPAEVLFPLLPYCDMVLIMTVEPGFGGQGFIPECMDKIKAVRAEIQKNGYKCELEIDGGAKLNNTADIVAAGADVIIAALGESSEMSGESSSRTNLDLPDVQRSLLEALLKTGKPVVLTLFTGRPLTLTWEQANVPAILNVWFGGSEAAYAIGDVLFGDVNPSGKLTMTFPKNVGQIPLFYNHKNTGRPLQAGKWFEKFRSNYLDVDNEPLYPFGYGLSYTTFRYSDIALSTPSMGQDGSITAAVTVTNTGKRDGAEVVQLYIRDLVGSITRPVRELKGFEKIFLRAGESKTVSFKITPELLRFYDYDLNHVAEPGDFDLFIGGSSQAARTARITLK